MSTIVPSCVVAVLGAISVAASGAAMPPRARTGRAGASVLHPRFRSVAGSQLIAGPRYVFITDSPQAQTGRLVDGRTNRTRTVATNGCQPSALGDSWLALTCRTVAAQTFELVGVSSGERRPLISTVPYQNCTVNCDAIAAIGAHWVAFRAPPADPHSYPTFAFQNIDTGQTVTGDPTTAARDVNLDTPALLQPVCHPLRVPAVGDVYATGWGSLTAAGAFRIAAGARGADLERCGSRLRQFLTFTTPGYLSSPSPNCPHLTCAPAHNTQAIVWQSAAGRLSGIYLPSRRPFTIPIPARIDPVRGRVQDDPYQLALTPTRLYVVTAKRHIWSVPAPR